MAKLPNLTKLSEKELLKLQKDVQLALASAAARKRQAALEAAKAEAKKRGFSLQELVGRGPKRKTGAPATPKYRHPENPEFTWTGRGRRPEWIKDAVANGKSLEDFAI